jgi:hypothetical protein
VSPGEEDAVASDYETPNPNDAPSPRRVGGFWPLSNRSAETFGQTFESFKRTSPNLIIDMPDDEIQDLDPSSDDPLEPKLSTFDVTLHDGSIETFHASYCDTEVYGLKFMVSEECVGFIPMQYIKFMHEVTLKT